VWFSDIKDGQPLYSEVLDGNVSSHKIKKEDFLANRFAAEFLAVEISDSKKHSSKHSIYAKNNNALNISILHVDKTENKFTGIIGDVIEYENSICIRRRQDFVLLREVKGTYVLTEKFIK